MRMDTGLVGSGTLDDCTWQSHQAHNLAGLQMATADPSFDGSSPGGKSGSWEVERQPMSVISVRR